MPTGGCEEMAQKGVATVLVLVAILLVWYVTMFMRDKKILSTTEQMCGGSDQGCHCSGNETFIADWRPMPPVAY